MWLKSGRLWLKCLKPLAEVRGMKGLLVVDIYLKACLPMEFTHA
jgi:hypothetical protein